MQYQKDKTQETSKTYSQEEIKEFHRCKWVGQRGECGRAGSISYALPYSSDGKNNSDFYCTFHFRCLGKPELDTYENERDYWLNFYQEEKERRKVDPDKRARFLISMGRKSMFWQKATPEQQQYALDYYKRNKEQIDKKLAKKDEPTEKYLPTKIGDILV